jgi:hypothetical protein
VDIDERVGIFMFFVGVLLLAIGLLFLSGLGSLVSACSLFFGVTFVVFGLLIRLGFFYGKLLSLNGLSIFLISFSIIFFAISLSLLQFVKLDLLAVVPILFRGVIVGYSLHIESERIYISICSLLLKISLGFFIVGLLIKVYNILKT